MFSCNNPAPLGRNAVAGHNVLLLLLLYPYRSSMVQYVPRFPREMKTARVHLLLAVSRCKEHLQEILCGKSYLVHPGIGIL